MPGLKQRIMVLEWGWDLWDEEREEAFTGARGAKAGCSPCGQWGGEARGSEGRVIWGLALGPDISGSLIWVQFRLPYCPWETAGGVGKGHPRELPVLGRGKGSEEEKKMIELNKDHPQGQGMDLTGVLLPSRGHPCFCSIVSNSLWPHGL